MEFGIESRFILIKRLSGAVITVGAAWLLQSYWALVIGSLSGRVIGVGLSYAMHPMRPRLSFIRMKSMLSFSTWNLLRGIAGFLNNNLHRFFVGGRGTTAEMGHYSLGSDIAAMPSTELLAPLSRVLFPLFVNLKHDLVQLKQAFLLALGVQTLIGVPAATGLIVVSNELVLALLGAKWIAAVPFIQIMGAVNIIIALGTSGGYVLLALGRAKVVAYSAWASVLLFVVLVTLAIPQGGAMAIATLRLVVAGFIMIMFLYLLNRELPALRMLEMLRSIWRPCIASALMALVLLVLPSLDAVPVIAQLLIKVSVGATVCTVCVLFLWRVAACPDGAEAYLLEKLKLDAAVRRVLRQSPK
jgi:O-antigen/teichoic acid export membrane protein